MSDSQSNDAAGGCGRVRRWLVGVAIAAVLGLYAPGVHAEPSEADRTTARALAAEGNKALTAKDYVLAEDRFRRAEALVHAPSLVVDHARSLVGLGRLADAYLRYQSVRNEQLPANAPGAWRRAVLDAQREIKDLEPKIGWLTITVAGSNAPQVAIDEHEVPVSALGAPFPADPGSPIVHVTAEGYESKDVSVELAAGQREQLSIDLDPLPLAAPPPKPVQPKAKPSLPKPVNVHIERKPSTLTYVALGVGGAGLAVSAVTGVLFLSERSKLNSSCPTASTCPADTREDRSRYYLYSYTSGISLILGLAGAGTGVVLLLTQPKSDESVGTNQARVLPYVAPGAVGVVGKF